MDTSLPPSSPPPSPPPLRPQYVKSYTVMVFCRIERAYLVKISSIRLIYFDYEQYDRNHDNVHYLFIYKHIITHNIN